MKGELLEYGMALIPHYWYRSTYGSGTVHTVERLGDTDFICGKPAWIPQVRLRLEADGCRGKCSTCRRLLKERNVMPLRMPTVEEEETLRPRWQRQRKADLLSWGCAEMCLQRGGLL